LRPTHNSAQQDRSCHKFCDDAGHPGYALENCRIQPTTSCPNVPSDVPG
jgi:hypothetical protein